MQRSVIPMLAARVGGWWSRDGLGETTAVLEPQEPRTVRPEGASYSSVQERLEELSRFAETYEGFVEILCDSAQYGIKPAFELKYEAARQEASSLYAPIRPFLAAFLPPDDRDAFRFEAGRPADAFEKLFAAQTLQEFQLRDDGEMIFRIMKTREALQLYGEHLRLLAARVA